MKCPYCATSNRDSRRFCSRCGVILGWACPRCTFFNHSTEQHCGGCGVAQSGAVASHAPTGTSDQPAASQPTGRKAVIKEEIQQFLKEHAADQNENQRQAPVSQDEIDTLFRR